MLNATAARDSALIVFRAILDRLRGEPLHRHAKRDEDVRAAYLAAVNLWTHASQLIRERLNALLLANSITVLGIVALLASARPLRVPAIGLSFAGIALCAF